MFGFKKKIADIRTVKTKLKESLVILDEERKKVKDLDRLESAYSHIVAAVQKLENIKP